MKKEVLVELQSRFDESYDLWNGVLQKLAETDALLSLAKVSSRMGMDSTLF